MRDAFPLIALILFGGMLAACQPGKSAENMPEFNRHAIVTIGDNPGHQFTAEVAMTQKQTEYGLMFREELADDRGMLFVFDPPREVGFWMKNTLIPLDIIFISPQKKVIKVRRRAIPEDETIIPSDGVVKYVLEIAGGQAKQRGIKAGDRFQINKVMNGRLAISNE